MNPEVNIGQIRLPTKLRAPGQSWATYEEIIPAGVPLEIVTGGEYWRRLSGILKPFDVITCCAEDGSFDVDIRLVRKTSDRLTFKVIRSAPMDDTEMPALIRRESKAGRYRVVERGRAGYGVMTSAGALIADGMTKTDAEAERQRLLGPDAD